MEGGKEGPKEEEGVLEELVIAPGEGRRGEETREALEEEGGREGGRGRKRRRARWAWVRWWREEE